ncbi:hypothetical protein KY312_00710 [Candidatus Woesearchaeota archaeon]|nr:hypothetical protein [Candidatus Woesearchaeota archaeon]
MKKLDLGKVEFSRNDCKIGIKIPKLLDEKLAHFLGIHIGDGHLTRINHGYRMLYNGHYINEFEWYNTYLAKLIYKLFNKKTIVTNGHNSIQIVISSKAIHSFLNKACGLTIGPKANCDIPDMIKESTIFNKRAFLRGLADTDFSLVFKNRHKNINYYPVIDHQTSNGILNSSLVDLLRLMGFKVYSNKRLKKRGNTAYQSYYFQINGIRAFNKWMKEIGFTNYNQLTKIKIWQKFGFLPPNTNINDRLAMLSL